MKEIISIDRIENINWEWSYQDFKNKFPLIDNKLSYIEFIGKIKNIDFKGVMEFSESNKKLKRIILLIPPDIFNNSSAGSEIKDYLNTYNILNQTLGSPVVSDGIKINELERLTSIYDISADLFPKNVWFLEKLKIIHTFIDHWGFIPKTYAEENK